MRRWLLVAALLFLSAEPCLSHGLAAVPASDSPPMQRIDITPKLSVLVPDIALGLGAKAQSTASNSTASNSTTSNSTTAARDTADTNTNSDPNTTNSWKTGGGWGNWVSYLVLVFEVMRFIGTVTSSVKINRHRMKTNEFYVERCLPALVQIKNNLLLAKEQAYGLRMSRQGRKKALAHSRLIARHADELKSHGHWKLSDQTEYFNETAGDLTAAADEDTVFWLNKLYEMRGMCGLNSMGEIPDPREDVWNMKSKIVRRQQVAGQKQIFGKNVLVPWAIFRLVTLILAISDTGQNGKVYFWTYFVSALFGQSFINGYLEGLDVQANAIGEASYDDDVKTAIGSGGTDVFTLWLISDHEASGQGFGLMFALLLVFAIVRIFILVPMMGVGTLSAIASHDQKNPYRSCHTRLAHGQESPRKQCKECLQLTWQNSTPCIEKCDAYMQCLDKIDKGDPQFVDAAEPTYKPQLAGMIGYFIMSWAVLAILIVSMQGILKHIKTEETIVKAEKSLVTQPYGTVYGKFAISNVLSFIGMLAISQAVTGMKFNDKGMVIMSGKIVFLGLICLLCQWAAVYIPAQSTLV